MHIFIEEIFLKRLEFELISENIPKDSEGPLPYDLGVRCQNLFSPDGNHLAQILEFDLARGIEKAPFKLKFTFQGQYRSEGDGTPTLEEFAKYNAPAFIVPYARELIANITSRARAIPTLIIPPLNIVKLIEDTEEDQNEEAALELSEPHENGSSDS